jgi:hypothetical protein
MKTAGAESWSVTVGGGQMEHAVLYVRDACQLIPPADAVNPPPLAGGIIEAESPLDPRDLAEASDAWLRWWRRIVRMDCTTSHPTPSGRQRDPDERGARLQAREAVFDPPAFASLMEVPSLQLAAQRANRAALGWWSHGRTVVAGHRSHWHDAKIVAEEVIDTYHVSPGRVHATIFVLLVAREWSFFPAPGVAMCSASVMADSELYVPLLRRAFESGLSRTQPGVA